MRTRNCLNGILVTALLLSACGGGGGGSAPPPTGSPPPPAVPPPPPPPPPPPASPAAGLVIPFGAGKRWVYDADFTNSVSSSTGVSVEHFVGDRLLYVDRQLPWGGRNAWRLMQFDVETDPGTRIGFQRTLMYVAEGSEGVDLWVALGGGTGEWRRVLSAQSASFNNTALLLAGGPARQNRTQLTAAAPVTVPLGTYQAIRATHTYSLTGGLEDIFETRHEYFADAVGPISADWNFTYDNNDPSAADSASHGVVALKGIDSGRAVRAEIEPNDDGRDVAAQALQLDDIFLGDAHISDPGRIVVDANVVANFQGLKLLQDWYRFTVVTSHERRIALSYEMYDAVAQRNRDLDLYLFREGAGGVLTFVARSTLDPNTAGGNHGEWIIANLTPGNYYTAVQAWDTPNDSARYAITLR